MITNGTHLKYTLGKNRNVFVREAYKDLKDLKIDTIAVCGISGISFGSILAYRLKCNLLVVRKKLTDHSGSFCEVIERPKRMIIVDDLICTGDTFEYILKKIKKDGFVRPFGFYLYHSRRKINWYKIRNLKNESIRRRLRKAS